MSSAKTVHKVQPKAEAKITKEELLDNKDAKWLSLKKLTYIDAHGTQRDWESCERRTRKGACDAVIIVPILQSSQKTASLTCQSAAMKTNDDRELVLILQFRPAVGKIVVELPAGLVDAGESVEVSAIRELKEETGYTAKGVLHTSPIIYSDPGLTNANSQMVFLEIDKDDEVNKNPVAELEPGEFIECIIVKMSALLTTLAEYETKGFAVDSRLMAFAFGASMF